MIIFGMRHQKKPDAKDCIFGHLTSSPWCCRYTTLWNRKVVVWPFTTIRAYCVAPASAQKITEITKSLKICYFVFI